MPLSSSTPHFCFVLIQEAMTTHVPGSPSVHIHVLSVHRHCRQQGRGSVLLWRYLQYLRCVPGLRRAVLAAPGRHPPAGGIASDAASAQLQLRLPFQPCLCIHGNAP